MEETSYPYKRPITEIRYDFESVSQEKKITTRVLFSSLENPQIYNLALLDVLENNEVSDITETRNKDMKTVLATTIKIIADFLDEYPTKIVLFRGSDERRQRLYRLIISRELDSIQEKFLVLGGFRGTQPEIFKQNESYDYFLISKIK